MPSNNALINESCNVYVASLPLTVGDDELFQLFTPYGAVVSARIMLSKGAHASKGYGFVLFAEPEAARRAVAAVHGQWLQGMRLQVRLAKPDASTAYDQHLQHKQQQAAASADNSPALSISSASSSMTGGSLSPTLLPAAVPAPVQVAWPSFTVVAPQPQPQPQPQPLYLITLADGRQMLSTVPLVYTL